MRSIKTRVEYIDMLRDHRCLQDAIKRFPDLVDTMHAGVRVDSMRVSIEEWEAGQLS